VIYNFNLYWNCYDHCYWGNLIRTVYYSVIHLVSLSNSHDQSFLCPLPALPCSGIYTFNCRADIVSSTFMCPFHYPTSKLAFYSILFHFIPFYSILFHILFHFIPFYSILYHFISFHFISFHFISMIDWLIDWLNNNINIDVIL
jgi:hypothetical protein